MAQTRLIMRPANKEDADTLWEMQLEFLEHQRVDKYRIQTKEGALRDLFGDNPAANILLAEVGNGETLQPIGYVLYFHGYATGKGRRVHIENLFIRKNYRSCGYGKAMLQEVAKLSIDSGTRVIGIESMVWNERAINFFKSLGFVQDPMIGFKLPPKDLKSLVGAATD